MLKNKTKDTSPLEGKSVKDTSDCVSMNNSYRCICIYILSMLDIERKQPQTAALRCTIRCTWIIKPSTKP